MLLQLLGLGVAAALTENMVFTRGLGLGFQKSAQRGLAEQVNTGLLVTLFTVIASACGWLGRYFSENLLELLSWTRPALFVAVYSVVMVTLMLGYYEYTANYTPKARQIPAKLVYGFIPLGTLLIIGNNTFTFPQAIAYGAGAGVGYLLAVVLNYCLQKRLAHSDIPAPFRGMPATLLSFGMISLALFGMLGHQLAV